MSREITRAYRTLLRAINLTFADKKSSSEIRGFLRSKFGSQGGLNPVELQKQVQEARDYAKYLIATKQHKASSLIPVLKGTSVRSYVHQTVHRGISGRPLLFITALPPTPLRPFAGPPGLVQHFGGTEQCSRDRQYG